MKKIVCIVAAICLVAVAFAGCASPAASSAPASASATAAETQNASAAPSASASAAAASAPAADGTKYASVTDAPKFKIGFTFYSFATTSGAIMKQTLEYTAKQFNCELVCQEWVTPDMDGGMKTHQNLIQAGCNGIITTLMTPGMLDASIKAKVPFVLAESNIQDPGMLDTAVKSTAYAGSVMEDGQKAGYDMAQGLYNSGARKWILASTPVGIYPAADDRAKGMEKFISEHKDVTLVATALDALKLVDSTRQAWTAHPETDGLIIPANDGSIVSALYSDGLQAKIKVASMAVDEATEQNFKDGCLVWNADGWYSTTQIAFVMLYNMLSGHDLVTDKATSIIRPFIYTTTADEYANYSKYILKSSIPAYSGDELKDLCPAYNPKATLDTMNTLNSSYSLQDVMTRHANAK